jgi:gliding motility-associated-like protein
LNYVWSTGETTPEITVTTTGQYFVTADNGVCESTDGVSIIFNPLPVRPFAEEGTFCFGFPPYTLELDAANPGYTYVWNTGETDQVINVPAPGFIQVEITSDLGCSTSYGILIDEVCPGSVYIPNSFSPDGDGINDAWMVYGENIESFEVTIFSRWGEMFFWSNDVNKPWIGQHWDGEHFVEPGAYVYLVKVSVRDEFGNLSDEMKFTGHVTIVR